MQRPPRPRGESVFAHGIWQHIVWAGLLIGGVSLAACAWAIGHGEHPQTMAFTVLTFAQLAHVEAIRSETQSLWRIGFRSNRFMLVTVLASVALHLAIVYVPVLQTVFGTESLSLRGAGASPPPCRLSCSSGSKSRNGPRATDGCTTCARRTAHVS